MPDTEPAFVIAHAFPLAAPVVGHRQRPLGFDGSIGQDDAAALHGIAECVLERIDHEFSAIKPRLSAFWRFTLPPWQRTSIEIGWSSLTIEWEMASHRLVK